MQTVFLLGWMVLIGVGFPPLTRNGSQSAKRPDIAKGHWTRRGGWAGGRNDDNRQTNLIKMIFNNCTFCTNWCAEKRLHVLFLMFDRLGHRTTIPVHIKGWGLSSVRRHHTMQRYRSCCIAIPHDVPVMLTLSFLSLAAHKRCDPNRATQCRAHSAAADSHSFRDVAGMSHYTPT